MGRKYLNLRSEKNLPELTEELLEKSGLKIADIDFFILHQANERIVKAAAKKLKVDMSRFPINMENYQIHLPHRFRSFWMNLFKRED